MRKFATLVADSATELLSKAGLSGLAGSLSGKRELRAHLAISALSERMGEWGAGERLGGLIDAYGSSGVAGSSAPSPGFDGAKNALWALLLLTGDKPGREAISEALSGLRTPGGARLAASSVSHAIHELGPLAGLSDPRAHAEGHHQRDIELLVRLLPQISAVGVSWERLWIRAVGADADCAPNAGQRPETQALADAAMSLAQVSSLRWVAAGKEAKRKSKPPWGGADTSVRIGADELAAAVLAGGERFARQIEGFASSAALGVGPDRFVALLRAGVESQLLATDTQGAISAPRSKPGSRL